MRKSSEYKYEIITSLKHNEINVTRACIKLNCSRRSIFRMLKRYNSDNTRCFEHKNKGKEPWNKISEDEQKEIVKLKKTKYKAFNFRVIGHTVGKNCSCYNQKYWLNQYNIQAILWYLSINVNV